MTTQTLPPISASLQAAIRAYGLENGWKNAARQLAYGPVKAEGRRNGQQASSFSGTGLPEWLRPQKLPGPKLKRNARGGLMSPRPGGYDRAKASDPLRFPLTSESLDTYLKRARNWTEAEWDKRGAFGKVEIIRQ